MSTEKNLDRDLTELWDIAPLENREFIRFTEKNPVIVQLPVSLADETIAIKGKYGKNMFLKVILLEKEGNKEVMVNAFLKVDAFSLRKALKPFNGQIVKITRLGTGFETSYLVEPIEE